MDVTLQRGKSEALITGITANYTSKVIDCHNANAIILYFNITAGAGTWTIKIQGKAPNGTYTDMYDVNGNAMELTGVTADKAQVFVGLPNEFKIVATETGDGATVDLGYELLSV